MKNLYLLRHAKSSRDDPSLGDFDRPLSPRGREAAPALGRYLAAEGIQPALVLCSAARRARETLALVLPWLAGECVIHVERALYEAGSRELLRRVRALEPGAPSAMIVGHNPTLEELARSLTGAGSRALRDRLAVKFPTGALAAFSFPVDAWSEVAPGAGSLTRLVAPRELEVGC